MLALPLPGWSFDSRDTCQPRECRGGANGKMARCSSLLVKLPGSPWENISICLPLSYSCWFKLWTIFASSVLFLRAKTGIAHNWLHSIWFFFFNFFCQSQVCCLSCNMFGLCAHTHTQYCSILSIYWWHWACSCCLTRLSNWGSNPYIPVTKSLQMKKHYRDWFWHFLFMSITKMATGAPLNGLSFFLSGPKHVS